MPTNQQTPRARVFISCGQSKDSDEVTIAAEIANKLRKDGFEPWIAVEEQTLDGIKEHIFEKISNSEYFIFVDFKREKLAKSSLHHGSLFSHQELALASYLGIDVVAFQESGVKLDGLLSFLGTNALPFKKRNSLPGKIADEVRKRVRAGKWNQHWRNEIVLEREPNQWEDVPSDVPGLVRRFFHIIVRNQHREKAAANCYVYLERATKLKPKTDIPLRTFELKWEGFRWPYANIPPGQYRRFDAFCISHDFSTRLGFSQMFSDWSKMIPFIDGAGLYGLDYLVLSSNFPPARGSFKLNLDPMINSTTFVKRA